VTRDFRLLVTGSRDWDRPGTLRLALASVWYDVRPFYDRLVVVHGACPTGADRLAKAWADSHEDGTRVIDDPHPALWTVHGSAAGPIRNQVMVNKGAQRCLAFIGPCTSKKCRRRTPHPSHGAAGCAKLAEAAKIPTDRYETWAA